MHNFDTLFVHTNADSKVFTHLSKKILADDRREKQNASWLFESILKRNMMLITENDRALELYVKFKEPDRIRELLVRNSRRNPESGYFIEMRRYYLMLSDEDISSSVYLMSAMSLLYSMFLDFDKSEYWYNRPVEYREHAKDS